jgi:tetraacyldisaccharide 4'-kinase
MTTETPPFWWEPADWRAFFLSPVSFLYAAVAARRIRRAPRQKMTAPVLCVGNFTVGGSGKTPVAIALARAAKSKGLRPGFLSRGYGGSFGKPQLVDAGADSARHVGDEPLLLAQHAPVAVSKDRVAAARLLLEKGCDFLIMDDGFQSARIHFDYGLIVVDATRGAGNGHVLPGGPLRARVTDQLPFTDALLVVGKGSRADNVVRTAARAGKPVFHAAIRPSRGHGLHGKQLYAFAGIGNPQKFYDTLAAAGGLVEKTRSFPDHHFYEDDEILDLRESANAAGLELVTTTKDAARLSHGSPAALAFRERLNVLEIGMAFEPSSVATTIIDATITAARQRLL